MKAECDDDQMEVDVEAGAALADAADEAEAEAEAKYSFSELSGSHSPEDEEDEGDDDDEDAAADSGASPFGALQMDEDDEDDDEDEGPYDDEDDMDDPYGDGGLGAAGAYGQLRAMAGYMSGLSGRFRTLLASLRNYGDPTIQLVALQELSEVLSMSNEDTLAGYFPLESFVRELIHLMGGPKPSEAGAAGAAAEDSGDEEERLNAAAIAAATAEDNGEAALLACRCLANLIEAMPYAAHQVVGMGLLPVLLSKLKEIQFIDLAEQVLQVSCATRACCVRDCALTLLPQTLEKISAEYPTAIVREGGLLAMLQFIDFFGVHVQRTAMQAAAHCCRKLGEESFAKVREVMPIIQNVLGYADQRLVESACKCVVRAVESYRHHGELLEQLLTGELLSAVNAILLPGSAAGVSGGGGGATAVSTSTYTDILKMLSSAAHASPKVAVMLLEHNIVETLYLLLTGSPAPAEDGSGGRGPAALDSVPGETEGAGGAASGSAEAAPIAVVAQASDALVVDSVAVADVAVLQNLAQRPKEQVQEALSLVGELMPPLPRDGVFDARAYSEKAYLRKKSRDAKNARAAQRAKAAAAKGGNTAIKQEPDAEMASATASSSAAPAPSADVPIKSERVKTERELAKESAQAKRVEMLTERKALVKRFTQLVLPTLVEVYAASVALHVRTKALSGILKIVSFVEAEPLSEVLDVSCAGAAPSSLADHASTIRTSRWPASQRASCLHATTRRWSWARCRWSNCSTPSCRACTAPLCAARASCGRSRTLPTRSRRHRRWPPRPPRRAMTSLQRPTPRSRHLHSCSRPSLAMAVAPTTPAPRHLVRACRRCASRHASSPRPVHAFSRRAAALPGSRRSPAQMRPSQLRRSRRTPTSGARACCATASTRTSWRAARPKAPRLCVHSTTCRLSRPRLVPRLSVTRL
jgi:E3 ubiquitin-protein ligase TRIP12